MDWKSSVVGLLVVCPVNGSTIYFCLTRGEIRQTTGIYREFIVHTEEPHIQPASASIMMS
jgi:hypothetical protein